MKKFSPISQAGQALNELKKKTLGSLAEVNYLLVEAEKTKETIIIIGSQNIDKNSVLKALTNFELNSQLESNIQLPQKFEIHDKVFWVCSNKIKPSLSDKTDILQVLVNTFFLKNLVNFSQKLKFIVVTPGEKTIDKTIENFTFSIEDFISIFPNEERIKLRESVICVVTQFNENNQNQFLGSLTKNKQGILNYFPELSKNLKFLYTNKTQQSDETLSLNKDIDNISDVNGAELKVNRLGQFLNAQQETLATNTNLINSLYGKIELNINNIFNCKLSDLI
ncbi:MAG: hypothetical protein RCO49_07560 [Rickettsia endosymbiont of Argas persicus]